MPELDRPQSQAQASPLASGSQLYRHPEMSAGAAALECFKEYARERPEVVAMWAFGLGFVLGWKLRIW
jgi:hypothetical protein